MGDSNSQSDAQSNVNRLSEANNGEDSDGRASQTTITDAFVTHRRPQSGTSTPYGSPIGLQEGLGLLGSNEE
eukprot:CAMPEP_0184310560 /NCGR_PEP_ID=MMETSP1049-20130417/31142_1 /TAXON_ID=77928 /ORGANISM="Proteomonas sulcata, Strain CCMP704" /LENGTH=71 /DNA_ID=CAMNT_0026624881 /DNA_START=93 /DNA_END=308 /DNA_ORIENTATION=+